MPGTMFCAGEEWNISFAGCGFRSVYYMGALSCILERVPHLVQGASKISGASSGCLVAASLVTGIPLEKCIADVMSTAIEARRHTLGVFHPTFNLLKSAQDFLEENLPDDGHVQASGRLCVSLTRMSNGENVLVSQFDTREELIQVLMCSCFFPVYCGMVPPSYRGVWYMDGALSNNMPLSEQRNTITLAPFSGESDIRPREGRHNFLEVNAFNVSIQFNTGNVHRVKTSFCPPEPKKLAEICHYGYMDALHFLRENGFLSVMAEAEAPKPPCCELVTEEETQSRQKQPQRQHHHRWLDHTVIHNLPVSVKKVLCESCRSHTGADQWKELLPVKVLSYLLFPFILLVELTFILAKRLLTIVGDYYMYYRQMWMATDKQANRLVLLIHHQSHSSSLSFRPGTEGRSTPSSFDYTSTSRNYFYLDTNYNLEEHLSPTAATTHNTNLHTSHYLYLNK